MYNIDNKIQEPKVTSRLKPGIYENGNLANIEFEETPTYSCLVLTFKHEGLQHTERIFSIGDKFYPKDKYKDNKIVGKETEEEAKQRTVNEWLTKMTHIATKFVDRDKLETALSNVKGRTDSEMFKDFANKYVKVLGNYREQPINFKLVLKYGTTYSCLPKTVKSGGFIEVYDGNPTKLKFTKYEEEQINETSQITKYNSNNDSSDDLDNLLGS